MMTQARINLRLRKSWSRAASIDIVGHDGEATIAADARPPPRSLDTGDVKSPDTGDCSLGETRVDVPDDVESRQDS